ncbi:hypothetical protein HK101_000371 [Irineochytrium annulatum]|nr:hypothetical protein HK101_000371 [Irineochytrium annulatum]
MPPPIMRERSIGSNGGPATPVSQSGRITPTGITMGLNVPGSRATSTFDDLLSELDSALLTGVMADRTPLPSAAPSTNRSNTSPLLTPNGLSDGSDRGRDTNRAPAARTASNASSAAGGLVSSPRAEPQALSVGQQAVLKEQKRREAERIAKEKAEQARREKERIDRERAEEEERVRLAELREKELEMERQRKAKEKRELDRRYIELEDATRRAQEMESVGFEAALRNTSELERSIAQIVVPDYVRGLIRTLKADNNTLSPTPDDFIFKDGFSDWQKTFGVSLQDVLCDLLRLRFIDPPPPARSARSPQSAATVDLFFKVMEARDLQAKEGKSRDAYCKIEIGEMSETQSSASRLQERAAANTEVFMTEVVARSLKPYWNQHLDVAGRVLSDKIVVSVWDVKKDYFLGQVRLSVGDVVSRCRREGYVSEWFRLEARSARSKDKYVGGEILLEFNIQAESAPEQRSEFAETPVGQLQMRLVRAGLNFKSLYRTLLRSCLVLDMLAVEQPNEAAAELLSPESNMCLQVWAKFWLLGDAFRVVAYLELLFNKYKSYEVPVRALLNAYEAVYANMKQSQEWLTVYDKPALVELLEEMQHYYRTQVTKYKEFYPKNKPEEALESTILMLRMIHKNPIYREIHQDLPQSFRIEIKGIMVVACNERYQKLLQLAAPLDENDVEAVVDGVAKLTELLTEEIVADSKYFKKPFEMELDIVRLTAECYLRNLNSTMEQHYIDTLQAEDLVVTASKSVFILYKRLKVLDDKLLKIVPAIKKTPYYTSFTYERWFSPFVFKWLDHLSTQTLRWVTNAVKADTFEAVGERDDEGNPPHSSSVTDLFSAVYQELGFIAELGWSNEIQSAGFFQNFAKTVNRAVEQYCDAIGMGEIKVESTTGTAWTSLLQSRSDRQIGPKDITTESCVKLCNIEFSLTKLDDMYRLMNVASLTRTVRNYRATLAPSRKTPTSSPATSNINSASSPLGDGDTIKGAFRIELAYAENLKPVTKAGLANAYLVVRVPENTVVPPPDPDDMTTGATPSSPTTIASSLSSGKLRRNSESLTTPLVLTGSMCELARTRAIYDTVNPTWDEAFTTLLPPVSHLEVAVFSRNLITSDELCGKTIIDFNPRVSKLRRKLVDHLTHDVFVDLEPQGRVLIRFTMEGEEEDVDFWFRRMMHQISPYVREVLLKSLKEHEAAPLPSKSIFSPLMSAVHYSNQTQTGIPIDQPVTSAEADVLLAPLSDYLNKNLEILCRLMSPSMAQEVIKRVWDEALSILEAALVPALFGQLERDRRVLNRRQLSMAEWALRILRDFFHADGEELGLPIKVLEGRKYVELTGLITSYLMELPRLRREYEISLQQGREKELVIRLVRLRIERQEDVTAADREEGRKWIDQQLVVRREKKGL